MANTHSTEGNRSTCTDHDHHIQGLEREVAQLREALLSQRRIGMVIGILAGRCNLTTAQSWALLVRLSQRTNVKVRDVARVLHDDLEGRCPTPDDAEFLAQITAQLPQPIRARQAAARGATQPRADAETAGGVGGDGRGIHHLRHSFNGKGHTWAPEVESLATSGQVLKRT